MRQTYLKKNDTQNVSTATFLLFLFFQTDTFLHLSARIPGYGFLRPTLLLVIIITLLLFLQKKIVAIRMQHPIIKAFGVFLLIVIITVPISKYPGSVFRYHIPNFLKSFVFLYYAALILDTEKRLKIGLIVFLGCQVIRGLEPLYLHITDGYWGGKTWVGAGDFANRLAGAPSDVINPNELGFITVTTIPFLHYLLFGQGRLNTLVYLALMPALLYVIILTMSRGAFLALLIVGWNIWIVSTRKFIFIVAAILMMIVGWSVMSDIQKDRYFSIVSSDAKQSGTSQGRVSGVFKELAVGLSRPVFGHGLGTTPEAKYNNGHGRQASHNMYAEIFIEVGLVGGFFFFKFIRRIYQTLRSQISHQEKYPAFYQQLFKAYKVVFWMFAFYSINYWGLSQYYWYHFAGFVISAEILVNALKHKEEDDAVIS